MNVNLHINYLAVAAAVITSFIFGWIWYGPLFGKKWAALMKMPADFKPDSKAMMKSMGLNLLGTFLTAHAIACLMQISRPSTWGITTGDGCVCTYALCAGFSAWLGFKLPMLLNTVAWENRGWKLFGLNAVYALLNLELIALVISVFG